MRSQMKAAVILLTLHITSTRTAKNSAPSVHEFINEQARIDDRRPLSYGNPLAGNSQQDAKIHAQHQQAMFNAERVRQHRAQIQRWNKAPQQVDSYMKAYHESQENHQLALEQMQQPTQKDKKSRMRQERTNLRSRTHLDPVKLTRAEAVDKNRNHRSYGSMYHKVLNKNNYKVNTSPGTTYDQGVTIKPNGLNNLDKEQMGLYTEISPSKTPFVYPKLYSQMNTYQSADDMQALNALLAKSPQEQIRELNILTQGNKEYGKDMLEQPIDLFFYANNPKTVEDNKKYNVQNTYKGPYANDYANYNDYKPIKEDVDDIEEDAFKPYPLKQTPTAMPQVFEEPTMTKSNNHKAEAEKTVNGNMHGKSVDFEKPSYAELTYGAPSSYFTKEPSTEAVKYLPEQPTGIQHLSQDGTGVSAFGDDDVSIKKRKTKRRPKRQLDSSLFVLNNEPLPTQPPYIKNKTQLNPVNKTEDSVLIVSSKEINKSNVTYNDSIVNSDEQSSFNGTDRNETLPLPMEWKRYRNYDDYHSTGEAKDYDYYGDYDNNPDYSYDSDYDLDDELDPPDLDYPIRNNFRPPLPISRPLRQRKPIMKQNLDSRKSFSNRYATFKHPKYYDFHSEPDDDYGPPIMYGPPSTSYGTPFHMYGPPKSHFKGKHEVSSLIDSLEPVYMLTESQMKDLAGHKHVNVQHLDVFQYPTLTKPHRRYPKRIKKHKRQRSRRPKRLGKFRKLHKLIHH